MPCKGVKGFSQRSFSLSRRVGDKPPKTPEKSQRSEGSGFSSDRFVVVVPGWKRDTRTKMEWDCDDYNKNWDHTADVMKGGV